jgi:hypothetical protein
MNRKNATGALIAGLMLVTSVTAVAQQPGSPDAASRAGASPADASTIRASEYDSPTSAVLHIASVEIIRSIHAPYVDIIRARGFASSAGWEEAELIPLTRGVSVDGVLQLILVARPPEAAADATGYEPIEAVFALETGHPYKGVNVHGATNAVTVAEWPGYSESRSVPDDCGKCVGKVLVPKGVPKSSAGNNLVREDRLPPHTRVVRPADGMSATDSDPNRLTVVLDEDDRIVSAIWE